MKPHAHPQAVASSGPENSSRAAHRPQRVALLGAGHIASFHAAALRRIPETELVAICDLSEERAGALQRRWNIPASYTSLTSMLIEARPDTVHILLPPPAHFEAARQCLLAGCDVLVEKPLVTRSEQARELQELAAKCGRRLGVNHNLPHFAPFKRLLSDVRNWKLGRLESAIVCMNVPLRQLQQGRLEGWLFEDPAHILLEQAVHPLSAACLLFGDARRAAVQLSGPCRTQVGTVFFRHWMISLECERGLVVLFLSFGGEFTEFWIRAIGQDGAATVDFYRNLYWTASKSRFLEVVDHFIQCHGAARQIGVQALRNLSGYAWNLLSGKSFTDPFSMSIHSSIQSFYRQEGVGAAEAAQVLQACELIADSAARYILETGGDSHE